jgi:hypothetical protein
MGIFEDISVMSRKANTEVDVTGACFSSWISSVVFFTLNEYGCGEICLIFNAKSFDNFYAGALCHFTIGRMG